MGGCISKPVDNHAACIGLRFSFESESNIGGNILYRGVKFFQPANATHASSVDGASYKYIIYYCSGQKVLLSNGHGGSLLKLRKNGDYVLTPHWIDGDQALDVTQGLESFSLSPQVSINVRAVQYQSPKSIESCHQKKLSIIESVGQITE